ncbi:acyl-CoA dehydrogenase [Pseudonocardiaceae bacterium YIM PH 21723]|nr:acyl-CoA dehydrogenase [Pseudonocardiaceae bacterium YIM PH 21723]
MNNLRILLDNGSLELPFPGSGDTWRRWSALSGFGRTDPVLGRLAEGHCDALAILDEAGRKPVPGALYGVWAARAGGTGAVLVDGRLSGTVRFCSAAHTVDRVLVAALSEGKPVLVELDPGQPGVTVVEDSWQAIGMAGSDSPDVVFDLPVTEDMFIGEPGFYLDRPGFWAGGAGVAAVWLGGAFGVLDAVTELWRERAADEHQLAHLGAIYTALHAAEALLRQSAKQIDADPDGDHRLLAWTCRAAAERAVREVVERVPRITGPGPLCRDRAFAQRLADLGVYVRQHHGERDLAALGALAYPAGARG